MFITNIVFMALLQNASLIYTDIYLTTKPSLEAGFVENNLIAKPFFDKGLYNEAYILSLIGNSAIAYGLYLIDDSSELSLIALQLIAVIEIYAIHNNCHYNDSLSNIQANAVLIYLTF